MRYKSFRSKLLYTGTATEGSALMVAECPNGGRWTAKSGLSNRKPSAKSRNMRSKWESEVDLAAILELHTANVPSVGRWRFRRLSGLTLCTAKQPSSRCQLNPEHRIDPPYGPVVVGMLTVGSTRVTRGAVIAPRIPAHTTPCLLYTSPSPRDRQKSRMPSSA